MASIFTRIIDGEIPSYKVYEDDLVIGFLSINPIQLGHVLVVPKYEVDQFVDVPDNYYQAVFAAAKIIAKAQKKALGCQRVCTKIEGFEVPHFHYHLIPVRVEKDFHAQPQTNFPAEEMQRMMDLIADAITDITISES